MLLAHLSIAIAILGFPGGSLAVAPTSANFSWSDCGLKNATLHFDGVQSTSPVHMHERQIVTKTLHFDKSYPRVTVEYAQFWRALGHWIRFVDLRKDACSEHPVLCGAKPREELTVTTEHPPLNPLTPSGMYRSTQHYADGTTGEPIGCVTMDVPFDK